MLLVSAFWSLFFVCQSQFARLLLNIWNFRYWLLIRCYQNLFHAYGFSHVDIRLFDTATPSDCINRIILFFLIFLLKHSLNRDIWDLIHLGVFGNSLKVSIYTRFITGLGFSVKKIYKPIIGEFKDQNPEFWKAMLWKNRI